MKKLTVTLIGLMTVLVMQAQIRLDFGKDAPLKKIQFAEVAIANLYVELVRRKPACRISHSWNVGKTRSPFNLHRCKRNKST